MDTPQLRRPTWWARAAVMLATHRLPVGEVRLRYRLELLAELWGMPAGRQTAYAWGVLVTSRAMRKAIQHPDPTAATRAPLSCRLHLYHRWHVLSTEDGTSRWRECLRCGRVDERKGRGNLLYI